MKMITRTVLTAIAISFAAAPLAQAQNRHAPVQSQPAYKHGHNSPSYKPTHSKPSYKPAPRKHFNRGQKLSGYKSYRPMNDYHRHGLKRPGKNQRWVKVDNQYLLINLATGLIAGLALAR